MSNVLVEVEGINYTLRADKTVESDKPYIHGRINDKIVGGFSVEAVRACYAECVAFGVNTIIYSDNPHDTALSYSAVFAADKGIPSKIVSNSFHGYDVITDEGYVYQMRRK